MPNAYAYAVEPSPVAAKDYRRQCQYGTCGNCHRALWAPEPFYRTAAQHFSEPQLFCSAFCLQNAVWVILESAKLKEGQVNHA